MKFLAHLFWLMALPTGVYGDDGTLVRPVNQTFLGDHSFPILPLLGMGPNFRGRRMAYVILKAHTESAQGTVALSEGSEDVTRLQILNGTSALYIFPLPARIGRIGEALEQLQFHVRGQVVVEAVGVKLVPIEIPRPGPTRPGRSDPLRRTVFVRQQW